MVRRNKGISKEQAFKEVLTIIRRTALLHYCYAKTLIEEFGEERGKELILKAIRSYGEEVGRKVKEEKMISVRMLALTTLVFLFSATHGYGDKVSYDGEFWEKCGWATKELIISAVFWGQEVGQDQVFAEVILGGGDSNFKVNCANAVQGVLKSLEAKRKAIDTAQVVGHMDKFYSVPNNKSLKLKWAFLEAIERIKGTPEEEIRQFIEGVKKNSR